MSEYRKKAIKSLGFPEGLENLFLGRMNAGQFQSYFEEQEYYYSQGWPDNSGFWKDHQDKQLVPLWEYSECIYCADLSKSPLEYISFRIDSPNEPTEYGCSICKMLFEMVDFHCFQIAGEIDSAVKFMTAILFPDIEGFKKLVALDSSLPEFEVEYDKYVGKFSKTA